MPGARPRGPSFVARLVGLLALAAAPPALAEERPLVCFGNEPFWSVDLTVAGAARFSTPEDPEGEAFSGRATRLEHLGETLWRGAPRAAGGGDLVVWLRDGACSDTMSDVVHPLSARVSLADGRFLAGCCRLAGVASGGAAGDDANGPAAPGGAGSSGGLEGPLWQVETLPGHEAPSLAAVRPALSVRFADGRVEGFSGCNRFAGSYTRDGDQVTLGPLAGTMMACEAQAMSREDAFRSLLGGKLSYAIAGARLTLTSASGATATLREAPAPTLEGVTWEVTGYHDGRSAVVGPLLGTTLTLAFRDGSVSGSAGCNRFRGTYAAEGDRISFGPLATTRKVCAGEGVMEQERAFLAALASARIWTVRDGLLDLHREDGETRALIARAQAEGS